MIKTQNENTFETISADQFLHLYEQAKRGDPESLFLMGEIYRCKNTREDRFIAEDFYRKAARRGHAGAYAAVGDILYAQGGKIPAADLWFTAAAKGCPEAMLSLGRLLASEGETDAAERYISKAAAAGVPGAAEELESIRNDKRKDEKAMDNKEIANSELLEYVLFRTKKICKGISCGFSPEKLLAVVTELTLDSPVINDSNNSEVAPYFIFAESERLRLKEVSERFRNYDETAEITDGDLTAQCEAYFAAAAEKPKKRGTDALLLSDLLIAVLDKPTDMMTATFNDEACRFDLQRYTCFDEDDDWNFDEDFSDEEEYYDDCGDFPDCDDCVCDPGEYVPTTYSIEADGPFPFNECGEPQEEPAAPEELSVPENSYIQMPAGLKELIEKLDTTSRIEIKKKYDAAAELRESLSRIVLGQEAAVRSFTEGYFRSELEMMLRPYNGSDTASARAPFVFVGGPGVGKTLLAETAARFLGIEPLVMNMSEGFSHGELVSYIESKPNGVVIFDEIEKAQHHTMVQLLPMLDTGYFNGRDCRGNIIIFTTNAGSELYEKMSGGEVPRSVALSAISNKKDPGFFGNWIFPPELCSRLSRGNIVIFRPLDAQTLYKIAKAQFDDRLLELAGHLRGSVRAEDDVYTSIMFSTGCHADARTLAGCTGDVFASVVSAMVDGRDEESVGKTDNVIIKADIPAEGEIAELFSADRDTALKKLFRSGSELTFGFDRQIIEDGKTAVITFRDMALRRAIRAEDMGVFVDDISMPQVHFSDVIGAQDAKDELMQAVEYLRHPESFTDMGIDSINGILLHGPAGTGKTMLAKALAGEAGVPFIATEGNRFLKKFVGESPEAVHAIFNTARKYAPCVLFIDEIDVIIRERTGSEQTVVREEILTALLSEMNGFREYSDKPVYVLGATNSAPETLDPAIIRRFDRKICVDRPTCDERVEFLQRRINANKHFSVSPAMIRNIAARSPETSLAVLGKVLDSALRSAMSRKADTVTDDMLDEAFESYNGGEIKKWDSDLLSRTAYHEAGHAAASFLTGGKPAYITVVPREGHGGYMQEDICEKKKLFTADELLDRICVALGGRAAEIVRFGKREGLSTGAASDLAAATRYATDMVCRYGMCPALGLAAIDEKDIRGELAVRVREEVNRILSEQLSRTVAMLTENRVLLDSLSDGLRSKNRLSGQEAEEIFSRATEEKEQRPAAAPEKPLAGNTN